MAKQGSTTKARTSGTPAPARQRAPTPMEQSVLEALEELEGKGSDYEVAEQSGMLWRDVQRAMRRLGAKGLIELEEARAGGPCGGSGTMLLARIRARSERPG